MASKTYSIRWENDEPVSFEVNGVSYERLDQISDEGDREKLAAMMDASLDQQFEQELKTSTKNLKRTGKPTKRHPPMRRNSSLGYSRALRCSCY